MRTIQKIQNELEEKYSEQTTLENEIEDLETELHNAKLCNIPFTCSATSTNINWNTLIFNIITLKQPLEQKEKDLIFAKVEECPYHLVNDLKQIIN